MEVKNQNSLFVLIRHPITLFVLVALNAPEEVRTIYLVISAILILSFNHLQRSWLKYIQAAGIFISLYFVITGFRTIFSLDGGTNFLTLLLGLKALDSKKKSNRGMIFIAIALNASYSLYNQDLYATLLLFGSFIWGFYLIYHQTLNENNATSNFNSNFLKNPRIYLYSLFSILVAVIFYTFFPRISFHFPKDSALTSNSGFSADLRPGSQSKLQLTNQAILSVKFEGKAPPLPKLYWIGAVLTETDGYFWKPKKNYIENRSSAKNPDGLEEFKYQVQLHSQTTEYLFHLDRPTSTPKISQPYYRSSDKSFKLFNEVTEKFNYSATSIATNISNGRAINFTPPIKYVKTSNKVKQLAESLRDDSPANTIQNFKNYFINNDFVYTLEPGTSELLDDFMFNSKRGFCSHYASALAILMRYAGFYSRVITGFQGGDYNEIGDFYVLRGKDAHAWMEYLNENNKWVRVDPVEWIMPERIQMGGQQFFALSPTGETDPNQTELSLFENLKVTLQQYADNFNRQWQALLYNYDREAQRNLAKRLGLNTLKFFGLGFLFVIIMTAIVYFILSRFKKSSPIEREIERIELLAKEMGIARRNGQSFSSFLEMIAESKTSLDKSITKAKEATLRYFFSANPGQDSEYLKLLKDFRIQLKREVK